MRRSLLFVVTIASGILRANTINVPAGQQRIQQALDIAATGDTILVEPGTYLENLIWPNTQDLKLLAVGDTSNTIVDGRGFGRVLSIQVMVSNTTVIRGFRFTNGSTANWYGAGILVDQSSPSMEHILVDNCHGTGERSYGAGIAILGGSPEIRSSTIRNNNGQALDGSYSFGGGMYVSDYATVILDSVTFQGNMATNDSWAYGGGLYATYSTLTMNDCLFTANNSESGSRAHGGGLYATYSTLIVNDCIFTANNLESDGWAYGGGLYATNSMLTMNDCILSANILESGRAYGGGVYLKGTTASISYCSFTANELHSSSYTSGGGLYAGYNSIVQVDHCQFAANTLGNSTWCQGGGIYVGETVLHLSNSEVFENQMTSQTFSYGNGIYMSDGSAFIENTLVCRNSIGGSGTHFRGGGLYADGTICTVLHSTIADNYRIGDNLSIDGSGAYVWGGVLTMRSSICSNPGPSAEIHLLQHPTVDITYSDVRDSWPGTGNIDAVPVFAGVNDYHLDPASPCIGQADMVGYPILDIEGLQRPAPIGTAPDMGAYEEQTTSVLAISVCCNTTLCVGQQVQLNGVALGGVPPYTYSWSPLDGLDDPGVANPIATPVGTTDYVLLVTDDTGAISTMGLTIEVEVCTGNTEDSEHIGLHIHPVPFTDQLTIEMTELSLARIEVMDAQGRHKETAVMAGRELMIDTRNWTPGSYIIRIRTSGSVIHKRVIKG